VAGTRHAAFSTKLQRFSAVNGAAALEESGGDCCPEDVRLEWDATQNSHYSPKVTPGMHTMTAGEVGCALSHISLWRQLVESSSLRNMMILEDDIVMLSNKRGGAGKSRFVSALNAAWIQLPENDWGMLYLGFSSRGERVYIENESQQQHKPSGTYRGTSQPKDPPSSSPVVRLYRPEYGYHTQAYIITKAAAQTLLDHLPVAGPIDVWLADHRWFGVGVYCAVVAGEGWRNKDDGTYEGAPLIAQNRRLQSDVPQSSGK